MNDREAVAKNIRLAFEIMRQVVDEPGLGDEVEDLGPDATLVLYDDHDAALAASNDRMAAAYEGRGEQIVRVSLQRRLSFNTR